MTDKELLQQWLQPGALVPVTPDATRILLDAIRARLSQCERCGEVNPAEIHTCTPQVCCQEYETCTRPCTPRGREQTKRKWQGLTDEEILEEYRQAYGDDGDLTDVYFARAIEAKLKEKNT
jgi:hypothetical protein